MRFENDTAESHPLTAELEAGTYHWCRCGMTRDVPWCDSSHEGTSVTPMEFTIDEPATKAICDCGLTSGPPYCDGSHTTVE
jgi:CDGSH-type Zn-finger protein